MIELNATNAEEAILAINGLNIAVTDADNADVSAAWLKMDRHETDAATSITIRDMTVIVPSEDVFALCEALNIFLENCSWGTTFEYCSSCA